MLVSGAGLSRHNPLAELGPISSFELILTAPAAYAGFSMQVFFDEYVGATLLWMKINVKPIVPVQDMALVQVRMCQHCHLKF